MEFDRANTLCLLLDGGRRSRSRQITVKVALLQMLPGKNGGMLPPGSYDSKM